MGNTISRKVFEAAQVEGIEMSDDYSGRGMFGDRCIGVVGSTRDLLRFLSVLTADWYMNDEGQAYDLLDDLAQVVQEDSMGRDSIYYFPGWTVEP